MQSLALQHTMMHRGAGATRAHARWHPYTPPRSSTAVSTPNYTFSSRSSSTSSTDSFLQTPADSVYFVSPSPSCSQNNISPPRLVHGPHPPCGQTPSFSTPQTCYVPAPQVPKTSYIAALVDQAVRSLTDIWHPEDIPAVFATSTRISAAPKQQTQQPAPVLRPDQMRRSSFQLPSPSSPSTMPSPLDPSISDVSCQRPHVASVASTTTTVTSSSGTKLITTEKNLVPIKTFVHEVLRRSRTTCSVLQSALCYIEAVRSRVPELVELEQNGTGSVEESESGERIENGLMETFHQSSEVLTFSNGAVETSAQSWSSTSDQFAIPPTVVIASADRSFASQSQPANFDGACKRRKLAQEQKDLPPLPALPSPLLCPRRTFLAALILASKFLQDRCYSNRAWAKLSGLPAREVGRCERALGEALEWRLWVGKNPVALSDDGTGMGNMNGFTPSSSSRAVRKTLSDSALFGINICGPRPTPRPFQIPSPPLSDPGCSPVVYMPHPINPMVPRFS